MSVFSFKSVFTKLPCVVEKLVILNTNKYVCCIHPQTKIVGSNDFRTTYFLHAIENGIIIISLLQQWIMYIIFFIK